MIVAVGGSVMVRRLFFCEGVNRVREGLADGAVGWLKG